MYKYEISTVQRQLLPIARVTMLPYSPYHRRCHARSLIRRGRYPLDLQGVFGGEGGVEQLRCRSIRATDQAALVLAGSPATPRRDS